MSRKNTPSFPKEISWLSFNERVMQEAGNPRVPEIQRLRYLGIFSNNLDEFYRVRVADVSRLAAFSAAPDEKEKYRELLLEIQTRSRELQAKFDQTYLDVLRALHKRKIYIITDRQFDERQRKVASEIFSQQILPELDPVLLDSAKNFPDVADGKIYLAIKMYDKDNNVRYGLVEVPSGRLDRFVEIPPKQGKSTKHAKVFTVLEDVILNSLPDVFRGVIEVERAEGYVFKVTRDAELELGEGINQSLIDKVAQSVKKRQSGEPERFLYDSEMPQDMLDLLSKRLNLSKYDSLMPGGRYHNAKDFMSFPSIGPAYLDVKPLPPLPLPELSSFRGNLFDIIREQDLLLYYPYHSFNTVIDLLKTAAIDPAVQSIKICLYRAAKNSRIVDALLSAKRNNKKVTAVVELQARFDEAANIGWANQLTDGGVDVIFGVPGLKVHCKLIHITRIEKGRPKHYCHIGTGNFNEKTAGVYTDFSLLTYNQDVGEDVYKTFDFISYTYRRHSYNYLMVSPLSNRPGLTRLIRAEIHNANHGLPAEVFIKCNNLVDKKLIDLLYDASRAGVKVRIICRGMMSLVPGIKGVSDNIEAISIVDRFLEHPRVYSFYNNGEPKIYLSSADLMTRNLDFRVEVTAPVLDPKLKQRVKDVLDIQWCDNVKARTLDAEQTNQYRKFKVNAKVRSQETIYNYFQDGKLPASIKQARKRWEKQLVADAQKRRQALDTAAANQEPAS
ncbi:MAG: polyphosphate kinase 1 [Gammaproteobacteria bacterium]|uniref:polyphosphate kinase 1 n=1 Tax=Pseudomaricurvus alcaniphilus TaxID=1166482 RepID=UPI00140B14F5|nr:polyphosphate kinase 1 [Pseudomaricurvus alcaniphilus]MBR9909589.1 polyphosphate kinase 1 [Gammaproteobacteria bacterium]NHN36995.1 polyphosphate kinase 1 [Pseudomaricurvus alcaniphilus]